jgi:NADH:ubiquinone oxidoreductase subunit
VIGKDDFNRCETGQYPLWIYEIRIYGDWFFIMHWLSRLNIKLRSKRVGKDEFGNCYYESRKTRNNGRPRRYVIYKGTPEASKVPADWHGWLHYTETDLPPEGGYAKQAWQLPHQPNLTGTIHAYRPAGHLLRLGRRRQATGDYQPWKPE